MTRGASGGPSISVIIPTYNRASLLANALASVVDQDYPRADYEVLVVDNASTDETAEVVQSFSARAPVRHVREPNLGLCIARNTGWRAAAGHWIVFFDDDALAAPGWLAAVRVGFETSAPEIGAIGGRVDPIWERPRPTWLSDEIAHSLTIVDWGSSDKILGDLRREWLVGTNMAVPKALLTEIGGFHPWLDRVGKNLLSSGDVYLQRELVRRGYQCLYRPSMAIRHIVPASRLRPEWFLRRYYWQGVSDAVMYLIDNNPTADDRVRLAAARSERVSRLPGGPGATLLARTGRASDFTASCFALIDVGFVSGLLGAAGR